MCASRRRALAASVSVLAAAAGPAVAQPPLAMLSAGALEPALVQLVPIYLAESDTKVQVQFATGPEIARRLAAGEHVDLLIAPEAVIEQAVASGAVDASTRAEVGKVGVGVTVRHGAAPPDTRTVEGLEQALLRADSIVYNRASTGLYLEKLFADLGVAEALGPKTTRYASGDEVLAHVAKGHGEEIGFGAITEIKAHEPRGVVLVGPLPAEVQNHTIYTGAVFGSSRAADAARRFLQFLREARARQVLAATGVQ